MIGVTIMAFIATFGFGIIFNIKGKKLIFASIGGALGWFIYSLGQKLGFTEVTSLFVASIIFSTYSEIMARVLKTPVTTLVICALIPLVPGGGMYYTMLETVNGNITSALETGIHALANAGTLALGVIFVSTVTRIITNKTRST